MQFSIIIPLYNKQNHIRRAIRSVLAQTYPNFELIIIDDGSTDNSYGCACEIQDKRIRIVRQENKGVSVARNRGIQEAQFDWVTFLDADDEWKPEFLFSVLECSKNNIECGLVGTFYEIRDGEKVSFLYENQLISRDYVGVLNNYYQILFAYSYSPFCSSSVAVKKQILNSVRGFPEGIKRGEDLGTWFMLSVKTGFAYINSPLAIIHFDAENRATMTYEKPLDDYYPVTILLKMIRDGLLSRNEAQYAVEYLARHQIRAARHYLCHGEKAKARKILMTFKMTKAFKRIWCKYYAYSLLPVLFSKALIDKRP